MLLLNHRKYQIFANLLAIAMFVFLFSLSVASHDNNKKRFEKKKLLCLIDKITKTCLSILLPSWIKKLCNKYSTVFMLKTAERLQILVFHCLSNFHRIPPLLWIVYHHLLEKKFVISNNISINFLPDIVVYKFNLSKHGMDLALRRLFGLFTKCITRWLLKSVYTDFILEKLVLFFIKFNLVID